ncbi:unnamed protein product [Hymenolepis diminuta]|uniref:Uncharacterized protein n=1 Tax=Hymenolepis diminuta TaxID=6216 RepID=A0A564YFJ8_HYMDI|nr:unnamed protein product [Hymenolepis diminuta]
MLNSLNTKIKALLVKFEVSKHVDPSIASRSSVISSYSIKPFASVKIPDPGVAKNVNKHVPEFIHDHQVNSMNRGSIYTNRCSR